MHFFLGSSFLVTGPLRGCCDLWWRQNESVTASQGGIYRDFFFFLRYHCQYLCNAIYSLTWWTVSRGHPDGTFPASNNYALIGINRSSTPITCKAHLYWKRKMFKSEVQENRLLFSAVKCLSTNVTPFSCSCNIA